MLNSTYLTSNHRNKCEGKVDLGPCREKHRRQIAGVQEMLYLSAHRFFFKQVLSLYWSLKVYIYMLYFFQWHLICILSFWPTATGVISVCYSQFVSESFVSSGAVLEC